MRVAAIYDVHGNLPALEAVIEEVRRAEVDLVVIGGDVVPGPMPRETVARLRELDIPLQCIRGNGEVAVLAERNGMSSGVPEPFREGVRWVAQQLDPDDALLLGNWPATYRVTVSGLGDVLFCHATPRSDTELFTQRTPVERIAPAFAGVDEPLVVCGHTHMQFDRMIGRVRVVNAGSAGMPFGASGAYWLLLGPDVQLRHTTYDLAGAAERIRRSGYPQSEEFAARDVLCPRSEQEMLDAFARAE